MRAFASILFMLVAGCGEDGKPAVDAAVTTDGPLLVDAAVDGPTIDAPPDPMATVMTVTCPANPNDIAETVTTSNFQFTPKTITIAVNDIVKFSPENIHNVIPGAMPTDPGLLTGAAGEERCLQFTMPGMFNYRCMPHPGMTGSVTVQ